MATQQEDQTQSSPSHAAPKPSASDLALERFAKSFEASAQRWELVVYPSLFAFIVLAIYGFYLIYSLTQDMHVLAKSMDPIMGEHMEIMASNVSVLSESVELMTKEVAKMSVNLESMNEIMVTMKEDTGTMAVKMDALAPMAANMAVMNRSMQAMTLNTGVMTQDMRQMGRPMGILNSFVPW
jgi:hypothetical protein